MKKEHLKWEALKWNKQVIEVRKKVTQPCMDTGLLAIVQNDQRLTKNNKEALSKPVLREKQGKNKPTLCEGRESNLNG